MTLSPFFSLFQIFRYHGAHTSGIHRHLLQTLLAATRERTIIAFVNSKVGMVQYNAANRATARKKPRDRGKARQLVFNRYCKGEEDHAQLIREKHDSPPEESAPIREITRALPS